MAQEANADVLLILDAARRSAGKSGYGQPARVLAALAAIARIGRTMFANQGKLGASIEELFRREGFHYRPFISVTASTRWGAEYEVMYRGRRRPVGAHLALGAGKALTCCRLHFFFDPELRVAVVSHVGRHLRNTKS